MPMAFRIIFWLSCTLLLGGCTTTETLNLGYSPTPTPAAPSVPSPIKIAVIPFEDTTLNGQEDPYWVGQASLFGTKLLGTNTISYLVTRDVKKEMVSYGFQLSADEIYSIQINRNDIKTLLRKIPYIQVDFLVGGTISHFFVQQLGRFIAEVQIEAYLIRPPQGDLVWSKKIGHREVRIPYTPDDFAVQSQQVLNTLLEKTIKDLFRNSDFRFYTVNPKKKLGEETSEAPKSPE
jgi:hypothetical protein